MTSSRTGSRVLFNTRLIFGLILIVLIFVINFIYIAYRIENYILSKGAIASQERKLCSPIKAEDLAKDEPTAGSIGTFKEKLETGYLAGTPRDKNLSIDKNSFIRCNIPIETFKPVHLGETYDSKVLRRHPNLPMFLIGARRLSKLIPPIYRIRWSGTVYQESWKEHPKCFLYSANFDARLPDGLVTRILALCDVTVLALGFYCQFWYNESQNPVLSTIYESDFPGHYNRSAMELQTTMIACKVPLLEDHNSFPIAVSVVKEPCTPSTNILRIGGSPLPRKEKDLPHKYVTVGLCAKAMFFYNFDFSKRLIEWVEILKLLGVSKFFVYEFPVHKNVGKVFDYYEGKGTFQILSFQYPPPMVQEGTFLRLWYEAKSSFVQYMSAQRVFYTDCLLRQKENFDFLAVFDYDEIPILRKHRNLQDFLIWVKTNSSEAKNAATISLQWKLHHSQFEPSGSAIDIPKDLYILRHNVRTLLNVTTPAERPPKSIHDTRRALYIGCHRSDAFKAIPPLNSETVYLKRDLAYTAHFRSRHCDSTCIHKGLEEENRLLEYKDEVLKQMNIVCKEIELHKENN